MAKHRRVRTPVLGIDVPASTESGSTDAALRALASISAASESASLRESRLQDARARIIPAFATSDDESHEAKYLEARLVLEDLIATTNRVAVEVEQFERAVRDRDPTEDEIWLLGALLTWRHRVSSGVIRFVFGSAREAKRVERLREALRRDDRDVRVLRAKHRVRELIDVCRRCPGASRSDIKIAALAAAVAVVDARDTEGSPSLTTEANKLLTEIRSKAFKDVLTDSTNGGAAKAADWVVMRRVGVSVTESEKRMRKRRSPVRGRP